MTHPSNYPIATKEIEIAHTFEITITTSAHRPSSTQFLPETLWDKVNTDLRELVRSIDPKARLFIQNERKNICGCDRCILETNRRGREIEWKQCGIEGLLTP